MHSAEWDPAPPMPCPDVSGLDLGLPGISFERSSVVALQDGAVRDRFQRLSKESLACFDMAQNREVCPGPNELICGAPPTPTVMPMPRWLPKECSVEGGAKWPVCCAHEFIREAVLEAVPADGAASQGAPSVPHSILEGQRLKTDSAHGPALRTWELGTEALKGAYLMSPAPIFQSHAMTPRPSRSPRLEGRKRFSSLQRRDTGVVAEGSDAGLGPLQCEETAEVAPPRRVRPHRPSGRRWAREVGLGDEFRRFSTDALLEQEEVCSKRRRMSSTQKTSAASPHVSLVARPHSGAELDNGVERRLRIRLLQGAPPEREVAVSTGDRRPTHRLRGKTRVVSKEETCGTTNKPVEVTEDRLLNTESDSLKSVVAPARRRQYCKSSCVTEQASCSNSTAKSRELRAVGMGAGTVPVPEVTTEALGQFDEVTEQAPCSGLTSMCQDPLVKRRLRRRKAVEPQSKPDGLRKRSRSVCRSFVITPSGTKRAVSPFPFRARVGRWSSLKVVPGRSTTEPP